MDSTNEQQVDDTEEVQKNDNDGDQQQPPVPVSTTNTTITTINSEIPNSTLYIKNIDWKIKKNLLRRALYSLCTRHGKVLEIITLRKQNLRGQAFVIMDSIISATSVKNNENNFTFFGKDLIIEYSKNNTTNRTAIGPDGSLIRKNKRQRSKQVLANAAAAGGESATNKKVKEENQSMDD